MGGTVGPDRDPAAVAGLDRIGVDAGVGANRGSECVLLRPSAVEIAADQDSATACRAGHIDVRRNQTDLIA